MSISRIIVFILCYALFATNANSQKLDVGWELWYPYQYRNEQQQLVGLDFDIFNAIVKKAELEVNYTELPWKRHLQYIKIGDMDVAMGASFTKERESYAYFTLPYRVETVKLFVRKGNKTQIKLNHLKELTNSQYMIGVEGGYYYGEDYQALIKDFDFRQHITEVLDLEENIDLLMKGHLDGVLVDPFTMRAFIKKYKLENEFEQHNLNIYQDNIQIMISKKAKTKDLLMKINKAIDELKLDGTLDTIISNWHKKIE